MPPSFIGVAAFGHQHIFAFVLLHHRVLVIERLLSGADAQCVVIIERDDVEQKRFDRRVIGTQQRFRASGAFLAMQPDDRRPVRRNRRLGHPHAGGRGEPHGGGDAGAELQQLPAAEISINRRIGIGPKAVVDSR